MRVGCDPLFFVRLLPETRGATMSKVTEKIRALAEPVVQEEEEEIVIEL